MHLKYSIHQFCYIITLHIVSRALRIPMETSVKLDKLAILLSGVCLVHCLLTPVLITLLPILTTSVLLDDSMFHKLMLWLVLPTSFLALFLGCRKHKQWLIAGTGILGVTILISVAMVGHEVFGISGEKIATSIGGIILAASHFLNYRACQSITCESKNCATQHHH